MVNPLAHAGEAEMAGGSRRRFHVEPSPVVTNAEAHVAGPEREIDLNGSRAAVPDGVGERLLTDPEQVVLDVRRQAAARAADADGDLGVAAHLVGDLPQGTRQ